MLDKSSNILLNNHKWKDRWLKGTVVMIRDSNKLIKHGLVLGVLKKEWVAGLV
jgi:hypothetical protein